MPLDYARLNESYIKQKEQEALLLERKKGLTQPQSAAPVIGSGTPSGFGTKVGGMITNVAKEAGKSIVRPFATPFAGFASGVLGRDIELPGFLGGAKGSLDLEKQAKISAGAALETAALLPAGKALQALRVAKVAKGAKIKKGLVKAEAAFGAQVGAAAAAGHELGVNEGTLQSTVGAGAFGAALGLGAGALSPYAARMWGALSKNWASNAEKAYQGAAARDLAAEARQGGKALKPEVSLQERSLSEIDDDIFPNRSPEAKKFDEDLRKKAVNMGFKEQQVNIIEQASNKERAMMREMAEIAQKKTDDPLHFSDPTEVPARPIIDQLNHLKRKRVESGQALDKAMEAMPQTPISITKERNEFVSWFTAREIKIKPDGMLDFSASKFRTSASKSERAILEEIWGELQPRRLDRFAPNEIHRAPREIRTLRQALFKIQEEKILEGTPLNNEMEGLILSLRKHLNRPLAELSDDYKVANETYAITEDAVTNFYKFLGKKFYDADDELANMRVQELLARLVSNVPARLKTELDGLAEASIKTGLSKEAIQDPRRLILFDEMISDIYDLNAPRGFQGSITRGVQNAAEGIGLGTDAISAAGGNPIGLLGRALKFIGQVTPEKRKKILNEMLEDILPEAPVTLPKGKAGAAPLKSAVKPPQEAAGALAGLEPETDEEGNIKGFKFNPEKAAAGMALMFGGTKAIQSGKGKKAFEGFKDITLKTLEKLKGRTTVSKQFISDLTNAPDLKQPERDLLRNILEAQPDEVDVSTFARMTQDELLPLTPRITGEGGTIPTKYENIVLSDDLRGEVSDYAEHIYESPIKTSAGQAHFPDSENYFGHTRIEDLPGSTRRMIEVQSDLYQKGGLEHHKPEGYDYSYLEEMEKTKKEGGSYSHSDYANLKAAKKRGEMGLDEAKNKLSQYNNPTAHFRMIREEVKKAAQDGKTKLQFPTGETAMKVEGLGQANNWYPHGWDTLAEMPQNLKPEELSVGKTIVNGAAAEEWVITDVLGDGKFKAVPKNVYTRNFGELPFDKLTDSDKNGLLRVTEIFDISGKIDTDNPIYRFYEKDVSKYVKNKYGAKLVTDAQGVEWWEMDIKPEMGKAPVEAFGAVAGIEPEIDEEGRITGLGFNPERAALGLAGVTAAKKISTKVPPIKEATKYKNIKDFIKAQGETLYHSSPEAFTGGKPNFDAYFGDANWRKSFAKEFGINEYEVVLPKGKKILDLNVGGNDAEDIISKWGGTKEDFYTEDWIDKAKVFPEIKKLGYEGAKFNDEYILSKDLINDIKTKSQLIDIWNKSQS